LRVASATEASSKDVARAAHIGPELVNDLGDLRGGGDVKFAAKLDQGSTAMHASLNFKGVRLATLHGLSLGHVVPSLMLRTLRAGQKKQRTQSESRLPA
jgi:hypothetical protein